MILKIQTQFIKTFLFLMFIIPSMVYSQEVTGKVLDENNQGMPFVIVREEGSTNAAKTDVNGAFKLKVTKLPATVVVTSIGYQENKLEVSDNKPVELSMMKMNELKEVVVLGNRGKPRTVLSSPVPIDHFSSKDLNESGQVQLEQKLSTLVPSYNAKNQSISDATAHFDPADLRGLGPSRTLVLINGKRKNQSSQVYLNGTPGKGEVGIDMKSIPSSAIKSIEILRDGASAQYGSDAIAGVINVILKDDEAFSELNTNVGVSSKGDGFQFGTDYNSTFKFGEAKVNLSLEYLNQKETDRAGNLTKSELINAPNSMDTVLYPGGATNANYISDLSYYNNFADWYSKNPDGGMKVGQPNLEKKSGMINITYPLGKNAEFYTFHAFTNRYGQSYAYYRFPTWRNDVRTAEFFSTKENFVGYHPTFESVVKDNTDVAGFNFEVGGFNTDLSVTYGRNYSDYTVNNSVNRDYLRDHGWSPRTFKVGGYQFSNIIGNLDLSRTFNEKYSLSLGAEVKKEFFKGHAGDQFSYYKGGSDSFAGQKPNEAIDVNRSSVAGYLGLDYDITKDFLLGAALRLENFSDFGSNFSYKVNGRYKLGEKGALRASYSTGFRAPTLHQRHITLTQYIIVAGNPDPQLQGTLPNNHPTIQALGVPNLHAETSSSISGGLTYEFNKYFSASVDVYNIKIKDRVLFTSQIKNNGDATTDVVEQILIDNKVKAIQFFINAVNTKTFGTDVVLNLRNVELGKGKLGGTLAFNYNKTELDGEISTPDALKATGHDIFDRIEEGRLVNARPQVKGILGLNYAINKFKFNLNNTYFGKVTVIHELLEANNQELSGKTLTDFTVRYEFHKNLSVFANVNNIFNVYPDELVDPDGKLRSNNGRWRYSLEVTQGGILGTNFNLGMNLKF